MLSIVVVNYNSAHQLRECISSIAKEIDGLDVELIIVDNASTDGSCEGDFGNAILVRNSVPMGYGFAANQGFNLSMGKYVLFCNPDMLVQKGTIYNMIRHMQEDESLGGVAGYYLKPDGSLDRFYNSFPTIKDMVAIHLPVGIAEKFGFHRKYKMLDHEFGQKTDVQQPAGAFLMVDRELMGDEYISPEFNMYFTDVDVCKKIQLAGKAIAVFDDCKVYHNHIAKSRHDSMIEKNYMYIIDFFISMTTYFFKYEGFKRGLLAWVMAFFVQTALLVYLPIKELRTGGRFWSTLRYRGTVLVYFILGRNVMKENCQKYIVSGEFEASVQRTSK